ncbi:MAG: hypothetical protein JXR19_00270 [Bacteroidia bacterium]
MKKHIFTIAFALLAVPILACDVCGGSGMNMGFGYIPLQKRHIIGINYSISSFRTDHPPMPGMDAQYSKDHFQTVDLWMRYFLKDRWMITASVPYKANSINMSPGASYSSKSINGLGDASIQTYYGLWRRGTSNSKTQLFWLVGAGLKMPTGATNNNLDGQQIQNMMLGSGSWDAQLASNFSLRSKQFGLNHELYYSLNGANSNEFKFGNRFNSKIIGFTQKRFMKQTLIPQVGLSYQHFNKDIAYTSLNIEKQYSGKEQWSGILGLDLYIKSFGFRFNTEIPFAYEISEGYVTPKLSSRIQLLYFINKKSKK